jgi:O-antigen ligase
MTAVRPFPIAIIVLLTWGVLAMGGSPLWAGAPIAVFACATGILGFLHNEGLAQIRRFRTMFMALVLVTGAIASQLAPLPSGLVETLSPLRDGAQFERLLAVADRRDADAVPAIADGAARPLSIAPQRTLLGLGFAFGMSLLLAGAACGFSAFRITPLVRLLTILGVVVALLGIYHTTTNTLVIYGVFQPFVSRYELRSAPFTNGNHQAGWLLMIFCLTVGAFAGEVAQGTRGVRPTWRDRILWLSSNQANLAALLLFAAIIMAIGILTTQSRSGAGSLAIAIAMLGFWSLRRQPSKRLRAAVSASLIIVAAIAFATSGSGVVSRLLQPSPDSWGGRLDAWEASLRILGDFWVSGTGFNTFGAAMLHYRGMQDARPFIEAHNDYLQLAVEGGLLVCIPALILGMCVFVAIRQRFRERQDDAKLYWLRVGAVVGVIGIAAQSMVDFTLQMPGAAALCVTLLAIAMHLPSAKPQSQRS